MTKRILVIDGHPDPSPDRFCHALAAGYVEGAAAGGHAARRIDLASIEFPLLRSRAEWESEPVPPALKSAQESIEWAEHLLFIYPLWLGSMPALMKAFLEQAFRPGFAIKTGVRTLRPGLLKGRSARIIVTMGMPALIYRWYFGAHSLKSFERNILRFAGIGPIRETLIGSIEAGGPEAHHKWLQRVRGLGEAGK